MGSKLLPSRWQYRMVVDLFDEKLGPEIQSRFRGCIGTEARKTALQYASPAREVNERRPRPAQPRAGHGEPKVAYTFRLVDAHCKGRRSTFVLR